MNIEPKVERAIALFLSYSYAEIINSKENLAEVLYFLQESQAETLLNAIKIYKEGDQATIFDSLMRWYPLSVHITERFIAIDSQYTQTTIGSYDRGNVIIREVNRLIQIIKRNNANNPRTLKEYEERIAVLEEQIEVAKKAIKDFKESDKQEKTLIAEVEQLNIEYETLKSAYTKESLEEQKLKLANKLKEKEKLKKEFEDDKMLIKNIEKELKEIQSGNSSFKKALKQLSEVVKTLPDSEGE